VLDPRNWQILVHLGRNKKLSADLGTLEEYRQEVKNMNKMSCEESGRSVPLAACRRAGLFYLLRVRMVT
jgi:hypothetical protein